MMWFFNMSAFCLKIVVLKQEGASKEDVEQLTKYKFRRIGDVEKLSGEIQGSSGGIMTECNTDTPMEHVLSEEDAVSLFCSVFFLCILSKNLHVGCPNILYMPMIPNYYF